MVGAQPSRISYEDLAETAIQALIELENLRKDRAYGKVAEIKKLFDTLKAAPGFGIESEELIRRASPTALAVYARILRPSYSGEARTISDLTAQILKWANLVSTDLPGLTDDQLETLGDFCVKLHRELLAEAAPFEGEDEREGKFRDVTLGLR